MREHLYDQKSAPPWSFPHGGAAKDVSRMNGDAVQISIVAHQDVHGHYEASKSISQSRGFCTQSTKVPVNL